MRVPSRNMPALTISTKPAVNSISRIRVVSESASDERSDSVCVVFITSISRVRIISSVETTFWGARFPPTKLPFKAVWSVYSYKFAIESYLGFSDGARRSSCFYPILPMPLSTVNRRLLWAKQAINVFSHYMFA
jgi:hypothetical protein